MEEETKEEQVEEPQARAEDPSQDLSVQTQDQGDAAEQETKAEQAPKDNHLALKRGRMIAAGIIAAVVLAGLAVLVAGVFQFTAGWLRPCAVDLRINDPAPVLWRDLTSARKTPVPLGVPENLAGTTGWKGVPAASE